jgi:hypothetical protein
MESEEEEGEEFELNVLADSSLEPDQLDVKQYYDIDWDYNLEKYDPEDSDLKLFSDALFGPEHKGSLTSDKLMATFLDPPGSWTFYVSLIYTIGVEKVMRRALETESWELVEWIVEHRDPGYAAGLALVLELAPTCPTSIVELMLKVVTGKYKCKAPLCNLTRSKCPKHGYLWNTKEELPGEGLDDTFEYGVDLLFKMRRDTSHFSDKLSLILNAIGMYCENILTNIGPDANVPK